MKKTVIQCVTALLCVIAVSVTSVISIGKISTAKIDAAKAMASNSSGDNTNDPSADPSADPTVDPSNPADPSVDPSATDPSNPADPSADPSSADPSNSNKDNNTSGGNSSSTKTNPTSKVPSTAADIAAYYNAAVNKAVNSKAGFSKKRVTSISNLNGGALMKISLVVNTVNDFLGVGTSNVSNAKGKVGEISKASISSGDISSANCKVSGNNYVITMTLKNGTSKANGSGKSDSTALGRSGLYSGAGDKKAFDYKNAGNIFTGINNAEGASVESVTENNKSIKVTATINSKTGNIVSLQISYDWDVSLTNVKYSFAKISTATGDAKTSVTFSNFQF